MAVNKFAILAIAGSLRQTSRHASLLRVAQRLAPDTITFHIFPALASLPLFNPDLDASSLASVEHLRQAINAADAVVFASPEYAHGISGVLKNALDWMVGNESMVNKPVVVWNLAPRAVHADAALREVLRTMSAHIVDAASITLPVIGRPIDEIDMYSAPDITAPLLNALGTLQAASS